MAVPPAENPKGMRACSVSADAGLSTPKREATKTADLRIVFIGGCFLSMPVGQVLLNELSSAHTTQCVCGKESSAGNDSGRRAGAGATCLEQDYFALTASVYSFWVSCQGKIHSGFGSMSYGRR